MTHENLKGSEMAKKIALYHVKHIASDTQHLVKMIDDYTQSLRNRIIELEETISGKYEQNEEETDNF